MGCTNLTVLYLQRLELLPDEWRMVIEAIDCSSLERLSFHGGNIAQEQVKLLVDCIPDRTADMLPLRLNINNPDAWKKMSPRALEAMLAPLREKIPLVEVIT